MAVLKLTKNELRAQQTRLASLLKYLPTLQLKKSLLQIEVNEARVEIHKAEDNYKTIHAEVESYSSLLSDKTAIDPQHAADVTNVAKHYENIAGVEVPYFDSISFADFEYSLFETAPWVDQVVAGLRSLAEARERIVVAREKKEALEKELRDVSIKVNLFEKILIPEAKTNIKKIKVFLGDQQLAAVARAKVAKTKIEAKKEASHAR